jgi:hypothetical protein
VVRPPNGSGADQIFYGNGHGAGHEHASEVGALEILSRFVVELLERFQRIAFYEAHGEFLVVFLAGRDFFFVHQDVFKRLTEPHMEAKRNLIKRWLAYLAVNLGSRSLFQDRFDHPLLLPDETFIPIHASILRQMGESRADGGGRWRTVADDFLLNI